jgi:hypothetical protein
MHSSQSGVIEMPVLNALATCGRSPVAKDLPQQ